jgi:hypothetical protein
MALLRTPLIAVLAVIAVLAAGAPAAGASIFPASNLSIPNSVAGLPGTPVGAVPVGVGTFPTGGGCVDAGINGQGRVGGQTNQSCVGAGLSFIGPSSSVSTVIGPTIITPAFVGTSIVAGGNVAIGP